MKYEDAGNIVIAPETRWDGHMKRRRIKIRQIEKAKRRMVAVDPQRLPRSGFETNVPKARGRADPPL